MRKRMEELLYREEMIWLQRSQILWLQEGDQNTNFFHKKAVGRSKKNMITEEKRRSYYQRKERDGKHDT
jgi:hypothetical protein